MSVDSSAHTPRRSSLRNFARTLRAVWQSGEPFERMMALWLASYAPLYIGIFAWAGWWSGLSYDQVITVGVLCIGSTVTAFPAIWGFQSAAVLEALEKANLDVPALLRAKREYLKAYGKMGHEPIARRWAAASIAGYLAWTLYIVWRYVEPPHRPLGLSTLSLAVVVFFVLLVLLGAFATRLWFYLRLAESRGFPLQKIAVESRRDGVGTGRA